MTKDSKKIRKNKNERLDVEFFKKSSSKNIIELDFNDIIDERIPEDLNYFCLTKKRTYCNIQDLIIQYNNRIFSEYEHTDELLVTYLSIKWKIDKGDYNEENLINDIYIDLFNPLLISFIQEFVEKYYENDVDNSEDEEKKKKFNEILQYTDRHCKMLHCVSIGMKLIIPLILQYGYKYNFNGTTNDYLERSFDKLFNIFCNGVDIRSKLWETIRSKLIVTQNSDKVYWNYVEILGNSIENTVGSLYQKLVVDIIPKYELDKEKNLINLNHVFINNNIDYTLRTNIQINFKPLSLNEDSQDDVSDMDKISINTAKIDETQIIMNTIAIKQSIPKIKKMYDIDINEKEREFYLKNLHINKFQRSLLLNFYARMFGDSSTLLFASKVQYTDLLLLMKNFLLKNNFIILPSILTANIKDINEKSTLNKKLLVNVLNSPEYYDIINRKYSTAQENINKRSLVLGMIGNILNNSFIYNELDSSENGNEIIIENTNILVTEILQLISLI